MSSDQRSRHNPAPTHAPHQLETAFELLVDLQSKLDFLSNGSEETRSISRELQAMIDEIRQALSEAGRSPEPKT
jgi:hypothetical protein